MLKQHSIKLCTFTYKFISNLHHLNASVPTRYLPLRARAMDDTPNPPKQKAQSLKDILHQFGPITDVHYKPFKCEPKQTARALLPSSFPQKPHPYDYFSLFFTHDLFRTITTNTNRYASIQRLRVPQERV